MRSLNDFATRAHEMGWRAKPGEPDDNRLLRTKLLSTVATYGDDTALAKEAREMADEWLRTRQGIDPSVTQKVLVTAAYYGDEVLAKRFIDEWKKSDAQQQSSISV